MYTSTIKSLAQLPASPLLNSEPVPHSIESWIPAQLLERGLHDVVSQRPVIDRLVEAIKRSVELVESGLDHGHLRAGGVGTYPALSLALPAALLGGRDAYVALMAASRRRLLPYIAGNLPGLPGCDGCARGGHGMRHDAGGRERQQADT